MEKSGVPYFSLDYLMMGVAKGFPWLGVDPNDDELAIADLLWPIVEPMAVAMVENGCSYLIEGVQLCPKHMLALLQRFEDQVRCCFVGFAEMDTIEKFREIRRFGGGPDDWLSDHDDTELIREINRQKALSIRLRAECAKYGLVYIECARERQETVRQVVDYLLS